MPTLSAPSKRSDAVSDADRVDAAHVAERVVVQRRRTTQTTDGPRSRVTEREQSGASQMANIVDLGPKDLVEGVSECVLEEPMVQRAPCRYFPFQQHTHKKNEREKKKEAAFLSCFSGILPPWRSGCCSGTMELERGRMEPGRRHGF